VNAKRSRAGKYVAERRWKSEKDPSSVRRILNSTPNCTLLITEIATRLQKENPQTVWNEDRVRESIRWAEQKTLKPGKSKADWGLRIKPGGKFAVFINNSGVSKRGGGQVGAIVEKLTSDNPSAKMLEAFDINAKSAKARDVHSTSRDHGKWSEPDIVVEFFKRKDKSGASEIHSIEVEEKSKTKTPKCQPQEVAQAFAVGQGADRSWLMFDKSEWPSDKSDPRRKKIEWLAKELGVGLITYSLSHKSTTWRLIRKAEKRKSTSTEREAFRNQIKN